MDFHAYIQHAYRCVHFYVFLLVCLSFVDFFHETLPSARRWITFFGINQKLHSSKHLWDVVLCWTQSWYESAGSKFSSLFSKTNIISTAHPLPLHQRSITVAWPSDGGWITRPAQSYRPHLNILQYCTAVLHWISPWKWKRRRGKTILSLFIAASLLFPGDICSCDWEGQNVHFFHIFEIAKQRKRMQ